MTLGSLFSGIGGLDLGLERTGFTVKWQVEVDPYCRTILERHWPGVHRRSDVRLCDATTLAPVDCIAGGFPCQDISSAGKGAGITGKRSGLWSEYARLVRELRPRWVLVENVPALRTRGADVVLGDLEAAGYACEALVVGARHVGAPHRRDRVWIVARLADASGGGRRGWETATVGGARVGAAAEGAGAGDVADVHGHGHGCEGERRGGLLDGERPAQRDDIDGRHRWPARPGEPQHAWEAPRATEPRVGRAAHGVSRRLALKALGNSVVPQVAEVLGRAMVAIA